MKTMRMRLQARLHALTDGDGRAERALPEDALRLPAQLGVDAVDVEDPVQMIDLVLDDAGLELLGLVFEHLAVLVERAHDDALRARYRIGETGDRQTALVLHDFAL